MSPKPGALAGRRVTLGVTGSVAAYKAGLVARALLREGARVTVVLSRSARRFVGDSTFAGLTGTAVLTDMFDPSVGGERHVSLAAETDALLVAPATADFLARVAAGRADDLLAATVLCATCPVLFAPAMHPSMWAHPATVRNVGTLTSDGRARFAGPTFGEVASGDRGMGRMLEPEDIVAEVARLLSPRDLSDRRVVVTAGPTVEDIDPVRFVSNRSSGKMGFALAERAAARGARVTLIAGPVTLPTPAGVDRIDVRSALSMMDAVTVALGKDLALADALLMSAAVGDYRPARVLDRKLKRGKAGDLELRLVQNPDILSAIGGARRGKQPVLVGFAVETGTDEEIVGYARKKLRSKRVDVVVANHAAESMGRDDNRVLLVGEKDVAALGVMPKRDVADRILDWVVARLSKPARSAPGEQSPAKRAARRKSRS